MSRRKKRPLPPYRNGAKHYEYSSQDTPVQTAGAPGGLGARASVEQHNPSVVGPSSYGSGGVEFRNPAHPRGNNGPITINGFALPQPVTFQSIVQSASRVYSWRWDEALRHNPENARAMRRDAFIQGILDERKRAVSRLKWHIEPENRSDKQQKEMADKIAREIRRTPNLRAMFKTHLDAVWYGRHAVQVVWDWDQMDGERILRIFKHAPVNGDKIQYRFKLVDDAPWVEDGTPCILVHSQQALLIPDATTVLTDRGRALLLNNDFWKERFLIHHHNCIDQDFVEGEMAGGIWGVGVRSFLYWTDWLRQEWLSWISDYMERVGQGLTLIEFEAGNKQAEAQAFQTAQDLDRRTVVVLPRVSGKDRAENTITRLETPVAGSELLLRLVEHLEKIEERYIIGQHMSSGDDSSNSLGGTGKSNFAADTKGDIIDDDANNLAEMYSSQLIPTYLKWNHPEVDYPLRFCFDVDPPENEKKLEALKTLFDMKVPFRAEEARSMAGVTAPEEGDETVENQEDELEKQKIESGEFLKGQDGERQERMQTASQEHEKEQSGENRKHQQQLAKTKKPFQKSHDGEVEQYAEGEEDGTHWTTMGGHKEGGKKHVGGHSVLVNGEGIIIGGGVPKEWHGKHIGDVFRRGKEVPVPEGKEEPKGENKEPGKGSAEKIRQAVGQKGQSLGQLKKSTGLSSAELLPQLSEMLASGEINGDEVKRGEPIYKLGKPKEGSPQGPEETTEPEKSPAPPQGEVPSHQDAVTEAQDLLAHNAHAENVSLSDLQGRFGLDDEQGKELASQFQEKGWRVTTKSGDPVGFGSDPAKDVRIEPPAGEAGPRFKGPAPTAQQKQALHQKMQPVLQELAAKSPEGMVPIHELRKRLGSDRQTFDETVRDLYRNGEARLISLSDLQRASSGQLKDSIRGTNETLFYVQPKGAQSAPQKEHVLPEKHPPANPEKVKKGSDSIKALHERASKDTTLTHGEISRDLTKMASEHSLEELQGMSEPGAKSKADWVGKMVKQVGEKLNQSRNP